MSQITKTVIRLAIVLTLFVIAQSLYAEGGYSRSDFNYQSYKPNTAIGFYTGQTCSAIDIDHVVSLKDAYNTGGASWSLSKKQSFANDKANHVPACTSVNRSKGASTLSEFLRKSNDGNSKDTFKRCGVAFYARGRWGVKTFSIEMHLGR